MSTIHIGCAGWLYKDWKGNFYPYELKTHSYLSYYAKIFNIIEINTTFYNLPTKEVVSNWHKRVPSNFKFVIKMWQEITHNLNDPNIDVLLNQFFEHMDAMKTKIYAYLFQFPPRLKVSEKHLEQILTLIRNLPPDYLYVFEFRHDSWFEEEITNKISEGKKVIIGTSYLKDLLPYYYPNQNRYYVRLIGDRQLSVFNRVQRKNKEELNGLIQKIKQFKEDPNIYEIFIIVNNHYTGFAPETANLLKKQLGLPTKNFTSQKRLSDYL